MNYEAYEQRWYYIGALQDFKLVTVTGDMSSRFLGGIMFL